MFREFYVLALVEAFYIPFSLYNFYKWKHEINKITKVDNLMYYIAFIVVLVYVFYTKGEALETISSIGFILAAFLIAMKKRIGWDINIMADIVLAYILFEDKDFVLTLLQGIFIWIALPNTYIKSFTNKIAQYILY